jgi:hypothetical protein
MVIKYAKLSAWDFSSTSSFISQSLSYIQTTKAPLWSFILSTAAVIVLLIIQSNPDFSSGVVAGGAFPGYQKCNWAIDAESKACLELSTRWIQEFVNWQVEIPKPQCDAVSVGSGKGGE